MEVGGGSDSRSQLAAPARTGARPINSLGRRHSRPCATSARADRRSAEDGHVDLLHRLAAHDSFLNRERG